MSAEQSCARAHKEPLSSASSSGSLTGRCTPTHRTQRALHPGNMWRKSVANISLSRQQYEGIQRAAARLDPLRYGDTRRRDASSTTSSSSTLMGHNNKLKSMDELHGPGFLTTLHWLFIKGYFQTTQQMQVSGIWRWRRK